MFGFFKNLIGERGKPPTPPTPPAAKEPKEASKEAKEGAPAAAPVDPAPVPHLTPTPAPTGGYRPKPKMERVLLPLKGITDTFPAELQAVVANAPAATVIVAVSIETVLEQLVNGRVAIPLAELRRISPINVFVADTSRDQELIEIPLELLVEKLDPSVLPRNFQRRVEVPGEIGPVFNRQGAAKPESAPPQNPVSAPQKQAPPSKPAQEAKKQSGLLAASPELQALLQTQRKSVSPEPPPIDDPVPAPKIAVEPVKEMPRPIAPAAIAPPPAAIAPRPIAPPIKLSVRQPSPPPVRQPVIDAPGVRRPGAPASTPASQSGESLPMAARLKNATPASEIASSVVVQLPLAEVSKSWPETIREELAGASPESAIHYPAPELGAALKSGKVQVAWKQLRLWIRPPLKAPADPLYSDALVELPLPVVAPLFMAAAAPARKLQQVVVNEEIPTPFARTAPPVPPPTPPKAEPPAPAPGGDPVPIPPANRVGALGLDGKLPAELIERACQLTGVAGAVIALKEGLVVASKVPPEMKPETLGAFLPQLFSRVEQSIGSMEIGDLQSLQFIAGDRPWQIWSAGPVLFAAVGRPNELLPGAQLKIIAAQLARQTKG